MVFYAFVKNTTHEPTWRYILAAPDADTIDEWWRVISKKDIGYKRLSPDFYTYSQGYPYDAAPEFTSRIMFTLLNDRDCRILSLFPHQERTDVRINSFFIRSKSKPSLFWWVNSTGSLAASTKYRSRFRFDIGGEEDGTVIVGKDLVSVVALGDKQFNAVNISNERCTSVQVNGIHTNIFFYNDLKGSFLSSYGGGDVTAPSVSPDNEYSDHSSLISMVGKGHGEEWELVK
ncbi:hypothetical protein F5B19DRAFT_496908 [Rostrohypoxylon terebratum]|nr:hypothetical protein F5B19DRAFT_496908 [Rostrohypoxylon terebratum]